MKNKGNSLKKNVSRFRRKISAVEQIPHLKSSAKIKIID